MSSVNVKTVQPVLRTAEGAVATRIQPLQQLIRSVMACMLWEDNFYESGVSISDRIAALVHQVSLPQAAAVAIEAREQMHLRHAPLWIVRAMANHPRRAECPGVIADTLARIIQRADELNEFVAMYWKSDKQPLSAQVKKGLARAFTKFDEHQLAKYNRSKDVKLRDVLFLCHSKPADVPPGSVWNKAARAAYASYPEGSAARKRVLVQTGNGDGFTKGELLYGKLIYDQLATPDTWEVELSKGGDKSIAWTRLLLEKKIGDLAFLRNLRNMLQAGISEFNLAAYGDMRRWSRVLPFRFLAAARMVPQMEPHLERWMFKATEGIETLIGRTVLLIDVSGSMSSALSARSDLNRLDAAKALTILLREQCADVSVYIFNSNTAHVPPRRGFALADAIGKAFGGTDTAQAVLIARHHANAHDRMIILTDEQSATYLPAALNGVRSYVINVAAERNGVGYGSWMHIDGFSEAVVQYIIKHEAATE